MKKSFSHLLLLPIIMLLATTETIAATYKYTGNLFDHTEGEGDPSLLGNSFQITVETPCILPDGLHGPLDFTSVTMTDGVTTLQWEHYVYPRNSQYVGGNVTVSGGVITHWSFSAYNSTINFTSDNVWDDDFIISGGQFLVRKFTHQTPGTWAMVSNLCINNPWVYTANWGDSGGVFPAGYFFIAGALVTPAGSGTTATAQQFVSGSHNVGLTYWPTLLYPDEYDHRTVYDSSFNGQWIIRATDGVYEAKKLTSTLDDPRMLPLAETFSLSSSTGTLTPTLSWTGFDSGLYPEFSGTPVSGSNNFTLKVRIRSMAGKSLWESSAFSTNVTSFTFPENLLTGGRDLLLEIMLNHYQYEFDYDGYNGTWRLENRSETFMHYYTGGTPVCVGDFDFDNDADGSDLAALIANQGLLNVASFAWHFGGNCQ